MTGLGIQDLVAGLLVLAALAWLVRRALRRRARATPFCGECPGCASGNGTQAGPAHAPSRGGFVPLSEFGGRDTLAHGGGNPRHATR